METVYTFIVLLHAWTYSPKFVKLCTLKMGALYKQWLNNLICLQIVLFSGDNISDVKSMPFAAKIKWIQIIQILAPKFKTTWPLSNHFRGCFPLLKILVTQSCPTLYTSMDCSPPGSSVHGILQARILEWVAISFFRGSSQSRYRTWVSCTEVDSLPCEPPGKPS